MRKTTIEIRGIRGGYIAFLPDEHSFEEAAMNPEIRGDGSEPREALGNLVVKEWAKLNLRLTGLIERD